jgi:hypothetical protein
MKKVYTTIGTVWKDELHDYGWDFIKYHRSIGIDRFCILDRNYAKTYEAFKNEPDIVVGDFPEGPQNLHADAWSRLITECRSGGLTPSSWLILIDADQVIVPETIPSTKAKTDDVKDILREYEGFASLQCSWHSFGSNGHLTKTAGSVYERFTKRAVPDTGLNRHTQSCVQPDRVLSDKPADPHHVRLAAGEISVNCHREAVNGPFTRPNHDIMWVGHYISKSKEEWAVKNAKMRADIWQQKMPFDLFDEHDKFCNEEKEERVLELWNKINQ